MSSEQKLTERVKVLKIGMVSGSLAGGEDEGECGELRNLGLRHVEAVAIEQCRRSAHVLQKETITMATTNVNRKEIILGSLQKFFWKTFLMVLKAKGMDEQQFSSADTPRHRTIGIQKQDVRSRIDNNIRDLEI